MGGTLPTAPCLSLSICCSSFPSIFLPHPTFPTVLLLLCSTRYCCCCSLLLHPFQHTPVDATAPCCTRSTYSTVATAASITISAFQLRYCHGTHASYRLLPLSLDCAHSLSRLYLKLVFLNPLVS